MLSEIEDELMKTCNTCSYRDNCKKINCLAYRILKIITLDSEVTNINIDDFFQEDDKEQVSLFDIGGDTR